MSAIRAPRPDAVIYVSPRGVAFVGRYPGKELAESAAGCAALKARAAVPLACGSDIRAAPARGEMVAFTPYRAEMTEAGPRLRRDGYLARRAARAADAFDAMTRQAANRHAALVRQAERAGKAAPAWVPPFSVGQVAVAREYAAVVERCAASGVKCASLEALRGAGGGGGDREVAILRDFQRLRWFELRIGNGLAKAMRRFRPSVMRPGLGPDAERAAQEDRRRAIFDQALVDMVCVGGMTLSEVLCAHGWGNNSASKVALRGALCAALDRMQGYDMARPQDVA
jgi:hypothetical protein